VGNLAASLPFNTLFLSELADLIERTTCIGLGNQAEGHHATCRAGWLCAGGLCAIVAPLVRCSHPLVMALFPAGMAVWHCSPVL
jgi:hypothetical protein